MNKIGGLVLCALSIWLLGVIQVLAEVTPAPAGDAAACPSSVNNAYRYAANQTTDKRAAAEVGLHDVVVLEVSNLPALSTAACGAGAGKGLVLFIEDRPLSDHAPKPVSDPSSGKLFFTIERTDKSHDVWTLLLGRPTLGTRTVAVSVGYPDRFAIPSKAHLDLRAISGDWLALWGIVFALMLALFIWLAVASNVLRADPVNVGLAQPARGPFSLARAQAAWWFFLIMAAYLFIGIVTGDFLASVNATALTLLAIGAGAVVGSATIDAGNGDSVEKQRLVAIAKAKADLDAAKATPAPQNEIDAAQKRYDDLIKPSQNFVMDIISDSNGVVFHRFQVVAWTVVLGIVFVVEVYRNLAMAEFDATLLGLQGLSIGTYLGLKIPEANVPTSK